MAVAAVERRGKFRFRLLDVFSFLFLALIIYALYRLSGDDISWVMPQYQTKNSDSVARCNLFSGKWVYDNMSSPLYNEQQCYSALPFELACQTYDRKDIKYLYWRWQPHGCDLPRFSSTKLLGILRGKRLVFVGDSINKNQWSSLICMLDSSVPLSLKSISRNGSVYTYQAIEYNAKIEFYWEPMLVESNFDDPIKHHYNYGDQIIPRMNSIESHARHWKDANILIFNSFVWWTKPNQTPTSGVVYERLRLESLNSSDDWRRMDLRLFEMALKTWSNWLEKNVNRAKTKLFFMSLSPFHHKGEDWGSSAGENCYNETEPVMKEGFRGNFSTDVDMMHIAEAAISRLGKRGLKVEYLNITQLSDYRKDAHPSIYRKAWNRLTKEQLADPKSYADCLHWCLPGVPDVWNEILYTYIIHSTD